MPFARDVVGRVAHEGEIVGDERRRDAETFAPVLESHPLLLDLRGAAATRIQQPDARSHELLKVLVARHDDDVDARAHALRGERADHVIRFVAL